MAESKSNIDLSALQKQLEYYLSDKNLKQDEFFFNKLKESQNVTFPLKSPILQHTISIDNFLNCNKVKQLKATKDDIIHALKNSSDLELTPDFTGVKRKSEHLPEFEPKLTKKTKKDEVEESKNDGGFQE